MLTLPSCSHPPSPNSAPFSSCSVANLTAHTPYEISAWAKTELGDSPLSFVHVVTSGTRPVSPSLKAKAINQTAVECSWTGPRNVVRHSPSLASHPGTKHLKSGSFVWIEFPGPENSGDKTEAKKGFLSACCTDSTMLQQPWNPLLLPELSLGVLGREFRGKLNSGKNRKTGCLLHTPKN